jgi:EpsI family protein
MLKMPARIRPFITAGILIGAYFLLHSLSHGEPIISHEPLHQLSYTLAGWNGRELPFEEDVVQAIGVTDYTNRVYVEHPGVPVQLYVGYYASQRTGDTIHSPKNCLPGTGWDPVQSGFATISIPNGHDIVVNQYVVQKDQDKQLVLYWYQGRGRVIASEYAGKLWMMEDAILRNRTDGALVRLVTPMNDGEGNARSRLFIFVQSLFPALDEIIPK